MILNKLSLSNFKGIKGLDLTFSEYGNIIAGDNATGKTSVFDAFCWLLFGKDSADRQKFSIKTLTADGQPIHNLVHSVTGTFTVAGNELVLERRYYEVWTRHQGEQKPILSSHTTDYLINGVPSKAAEFQSRVNDLTGSADLFKILTNVMFFSTILPWKERRRMLFDMAGDTGADAKLMSLKMFAPLSPLLNGKSIDELRRELAAKVKEVRAELERIPIRIDEIMLRLPTTTVNTATLAKEKASREKELAAITAGLDSARALFESNKKAVALVCALETEMLQRTAKLERDYLYEVAKARSEADSLEARIVLIDQNISALRDVATANPSAWDVDIARILEEIAAKKAEKLTVKADDVTCTMCGQELPGGAKETRMAELVASFEQRQALVVRRLEMELDAINKSKQRDIDLVKQAADRLKDAKGKKSSAVEAAAKARAVVDKMSGHMPMVETDPEYVKLSDMLAKAKRSAALVVDEPIQDDKEARRRDIAQEIANITRAMVSAENAAEDRARIAELEQQQKTLADLLAQREKIQFLCDEYTTKWARLTEKTINDMFHTVNFELFRPQVNGGIDECCEAIIDGVPYSDANTAARINAGLEIIDTISRHYNVQAPLFIDNAEAVVRIVPVPLQIIELRVSSLPVLTITEKL